MCFSSPGLGRMLVLATRPIQVEQCVPFFFCHNLFKPTAPILTVSAAASGSVAEAERTLLWKLMHFLPMKEFVLEIKKPVMDRWKELGYTEDLFTSDNPIKFLQYDTQIPLVRPLYSFYVASDTDAPFLHVPRMHLPWTAKINSHLVPVPDDAHMRWMTEESFEWCARVGRVVHSLRDAFMGGQFAQLTPWPRWLVQHELAKSAVEPRDPYMYMLAIQWLTGREEDGIATVVAASGGKLTLEAMQKLAALHDTAVMEQTSSLAHRDKPFLDQLHQSLEDWDRCSEMPFPAVSFERTPCRDRIWQFYFPPSRVKLMASATGQPTPWITHFKPESSCAHIRKLIELIEAKLSERKIRSEIEQCAQMGAEGYEDLPAAYRAMWASLLTLANETDAAASSSSTSSK